MLAPLRTTLVLGSQPFFECDMDIRAALRGPAGKVVTVIVLLAGATALWAAWRTVNPPNPAGSPMFLEIADHYAYPQELTAGMRIPTKGPHGFDAYPAEPCYWTADGHPKSTPDWVVLNSALGKQGPTFCPVCHRLVVFRNPSPSPGVKPPPTEQEYFSER